MWKDLSIQQKSEVMKMAISQGLTDLNEIKKMYDASIPNIEASSVNNTYSSVPYNPSPKDVRYAYGGPLGNIYKGTGNKSQKLSKAERENRAMWAKGQPFYEEMSLWNTGLSDVALAGILGNIGLESGFDYKSTKGTHHGYLQNQDSIRDYIKKYYGGYGHKEQMQYLRDGLTGKLRGRDSSIGKQMQARFDGYIKAVANVTDPMVASQLWEQHYERSRGQAMGKRQRYAKYFYEQLTPQEKQELVQQMTSPEMDYNTRFAGQLAVDPDFLYLDPNMSFFDALTKAGVHFKTSNPSGYRSPAKQKAMGFKTKDSQHSHKRDDGTAWALDIVPAKGYTFADLQRELTHPALQVYFRNNGLGVYDETTQEVLDKTGGTGPHYHVGRNKFGPKGSMAITYNNWVKKYNPALPEAYKMPIDLVEVSPEQSIYHHPANDLVWNPPTTEITPEDLNREIAPLLMQNNKPLIVEPLNNSEPSKSFDDIWDQIFPRVENTQEEFNPLLDPSTQFTALQSRPRYQMKPTPIINMPTSNGGNGYMLFKPLANGGNLFDDGSYLRNYQWRIMPETDAVYNDYNTGFPVQAGDKVWTDEQGNIVTTDSNPNAAADFAVQYRNPRFELDYPEITIEGNGKGYFTGESFADRYARELAAPIAKNADVDNTFKEQNQQLVDFEIEKERQHRANEEFNRQVDNFFLANWLRPSQLVGAFNPGGVNDDVTFGERLLLGTSNYGLWNPNSKFLREHPYLAEGANIIFDLAAPQAILNGIPEMYNAARYNPYTLSRAMNSALKGAEIPREVLVPKSRFKLGDLELNDPNLMYHYDYGDYFGGYGRRGPYVEDGLLYPGETTVEGQKDYSWWNKGQPFSRFSKNGSSFGYSRMMTTYKDNPNLINVRSQDYPIGQWNGKNGFVRTSEYVSSEPIDVGHSTYIFDPEYGFRRTDTPYNFTTEVGTLDDAYARAVFYGDKEAIQRLRDLHFSDASGGSSLVPWFHGSAERNLTSFNPYAESGTFEGSGNTTFLALDRPIAAYYGREIPNKSSMRPFEQLIRKLDEGKVYSMYANVHNPKIVDYKGASFNGFGTKIYYIDPLTEETVSIKPTTGQEYFPHNYYEGPTKLNEFTGEQGIPVTIGDTETVVAPQDLTYQRVFVNKSSAQAAEEAIQEGYDAAILDNIVEGVVKNKDGTYLSTTDLAVGDPRLLKSSDAITYDNLGLPIPLRFRDNFFLNDFRYSTGGKLKRKTN